MFAVHAHVEEKEKEKEKKHKHHTTPTTTATTTTTIDDSESSPSALSLPFAGPALFWLLLSFLPVEVGDFTVVVVVVFIVVVVVVVVVVVFEAGGLAEVMTETNFVVEEVRGVGGENGRGKPDVWEVFSTG